MSEEVKRRDLLSPKWGEATIVFPYNLHSETATKIFTPPISRSVTHQYTHTDMPSHTPSSIDAALSRFVKYPAHLRKLLTESNAVISGSFAVQFFLNETWSDSDLDIDVGADPTRGPQGELQWTNAQKLVDYLEQIEGYDCAKEAGNYAARQEIEIVSRISSAGAILIESNLASATGSPSGHWDVHTRIGSCAHGYLLTDSRSNRSTVHRTTAPPTAVRKSSSCSSRRSRRNISSRTTTQHTSSTSSPALRRTVSFRN